MKELSVNPRRNFPVFEPRQHDPGAEVVAIPEAVFLFVCTSDYDSGGFGREARTLGGSNGEGIFEMEILLKNQGVRFPESWPWTLSDLDIFAPGK